MEHDDLYKLIIKRSNATQTSAPEDRLILYNCMGIDGVSWRTGIHVGSLWLLYSSGFAAG